MLFWFAVGCFGYLLTSITSYGLLLAWFVDIGGDRDIPSDRKVAAALSILGPIGLILAVDALTTSAFKPQRIRFRLW